MMGVGTLLYVLEWREVSKHQVCENGDTSLSYKKKEPSRFAPARISRPQSTKPSLPS